MTGLVDIHRAYRDDLLKHGLLISMGVDGLYGRSGLFETVVEGINAAFSQVGDADRPEVMRFPPGIGKWQLEQSGYLKSSPQLVGTIHSFNGEDSDHRAMLDTLDKGGDWTANQRTTQVALAPAACYGVYPAVGARGRMGEGGALVDCYTYCFRHEPSVDPARMQMFRQREHVRLGSEAQALEFRKKWMERGQAIIGSFGLPFDVDVANDPFFGRTGRLLAASQRDESLKFELLVPIHAREHPTACCSFNYHRDLFGRAWGIETAAGTAAHTACVGFGVERITLALFKHHGFAVEKWPDKVRGVLGLEAADILGLRAAAWTPQLLHAPDRIWLETNCYIDVWAELLPALGHPAEAALAFTVRQDFEGDHFTFFKFPLEDLEALFGLAVQELAIYDTIESHTLGQLRRGRPVLIEVDAHWLPDAGPIYRKGHVKTTVAAIALDPANKRFGYFHNTGYHELAGEDFDGLFRKPAAPDYLFPYVEFVKRDGPVLTGQALVAGSLGLLRAHLAHRPRANPIAAWRAALPQHLETMAARDMDYFHLYAFNLPRQLGANFEMLGTYLDWLGGTDAAAAAARRIAEGAKAVQFQLARMANRRRFDPARLDLAPLEADYDLIMTALTTRFA